MEMQYVKDLIMDAAGVWRGFDAFTNCSKLEHDIILGMLSTFQHIWRYQPLSKFDLTY